jgi:hypothetical protein
LSLLVTDVRQHVNENEFENDVSYVRYLTDANEESAKVNDIATDYINSTGTSSQCIGCGLLTILNKES